MHMAGAKGEVVEFDSDLYAEEDDDRTTPYPGGVPPAETHIGALLFNVLPPLETTCCSLVGGLCMDPRCQICIRVLAQRARMDLDDVEIARFLSGINEKK